ncbi:hypothetical protein [Pseudomonas sp. NUPR-001]|uniref:hypothetical protein n=1 Tax=Pseudomonas sp. NUPR-001 TaxID=3416058 RepID=UPI003F9984CD
MAVLLGRAPKKQKRRLEPKLQAPLPGRFMWFHLQIAIDLRERCNGTKAGSVPTAKAFKTAVSTVSASQ